MTYQYSDPQEGRFVRRLNRFLCEVRLGDRIVEAHVPNTSRLSELQEPGNPVIVVPAHSAARKTRYTLVHMMKKGVWLNIDSRAPNRLVLDAAEADPSLLGLDPTRARIWRREFTYGRSRLDGAYGTRPDASRDSFELRGLVEVKGVTLEEDTVAYFPGAPTRRGRRHLRELAQAAAAGLGAHVVFCLQIPYATRLRPARTIDPAFGHAYDEAKAAGVGMHAFRCRVSPGEVSLAESVPCE